MYKDTYNVIYGTRLRLFVSLILFLVGSMTALIAYNIEIGNILFCFYFVLLIFSVFPFGCSSIF